MLWLALIAVLAFAGVVLLRRGSARRERADLFDTSPPRGGGLLLCDRCGAENGHSGLCVGCGARV